MTYEAPHVWNTQEILSLLDGLDCEITVRAPGGDYDSEGIVLERPTNEYRLFICGLNPELSPEDPSKDYPIWAIELTDGEDWTGGCNSKNPEDIRLYGEVRARLAEYRIVDTYETIF